MNTPKFRSPNSSQPSRECEENPIELVVSVVLTSFAVGLIPVMCASTMQPRGEIAPVLGEATLWDQAGFER